MLTALLTTATLAAPGGDFFPILPWDNLFGWDTKVTGFKDPLEGVAECNFTVAGFVQPGQVAKCAKLGLKAIVGRPESPEPGHKNWLGTTAEEIDAAVKLRVEQSGASDTVLGYFITDEPGTPKFPMLATAVAAVAKYAPGKLAYINLYPGYATIGNPDESQLGAASFTEYLERFVAEVKPEMLSYDNYKIFTSDNLQSRDQGASYFRDLMEVRRVAQKHDLPFWNTVCSNQIRNFTTIPSPANLMLQAYTTLAAGGRGIAWYKYFQGGYAYAPIDNNGNRTDTWYYLKDVNRQVKVLGPIMNRLKSTGVFYTEPAPANGLPKLPGKLIESVDSRTSIKGFSDFKPPLMIGEFEGKGGSPYVMVVNLSLEKSANFALHTQKPYSKKQVISAVDGAAHPFDETNGQWLVPGQGVLIELK
jgi:hypothetical protein